MRTIKFRGKDVNGKWHVGLLSISQGLTNQPDEGYYISNDGGYPWAYQVIPETVGQFIGSTDRYQNEVYQGDIVEDTWGAISEIVYSEKYCMFVPVPVGCTMEDFDWEWSFWNQPANEFLEVVGNRWENPDLLEVQVELDVI